MLMEDLSLIELTRKLLTFNNINPPGNEEGIARFCAGILTSNGFTVKLPEFDSGRLHLVAEKGISTHRAPVVLSGHFDTVPLGATEWSTDPFAGEIRDNKIFGRGSSDMKGGLAAMMLAAIDAFRKGTPECGVRLVFTAAEELGCKGVQQLISDKADAGYASAVVVGEPTSNIPATGHKGAIYLNATTSGKTAHSSMPHLGDNAIYKAAESILKARDFRFDTEEDKLLGYPTINVGKMSGGLNLNSVPDHAEFTIDIRTTSKTDHETILKRLSAELGTSTKLEVLVNMTSVYTSDNDPFVKLVYDICGVTNETSGYPKALPYLTDGSVLQKVYGGVPTIILGPGEAEMAHKTDEFCYLSKLDEAYRIYKDIILKWRNYIC
jgi:succinyl-diaminopimelate desuccinylase